MTNLKNKYEEIEVNSERWFDLTPLLNEEFKDIKGYEGIYQISNYGRVKNIRKYNAISNQYYKREKILKCLINKGNYLKVGLIKDKIKKCCLIHRLVATHFIDNNENNKEINHIDTNKHNNRIDNLEWCSRSENMKHAFKNNLCNKQMNHLKDIINSNKKKVLQYSLNDILIKEWESVAQIEKELGYSHSVIGKCCLNKPHCLSAYGYIWKYKE